MKLKTEVKDGHINSRGYAIDDRDPTPAGVAADLAHDSLYAHALVQAMRDALDVTYCGPSTREGTMQWTALRAAELMREWGAK
jgi:hypothetical protein